MGLQEGGNVCFSVDLGLVHLFPSDVSDLEFTIDCDLVILMLGTCLKSVLDDSSRVCSLCCRL